MAKKSVRKILDSKKADSVINDLYEYGVLQSTIIHTIILLLMALTFSYTESPSTIKLSLSFSSETSSENVNLIEIDLTDLENQYANTENEQEQHLDSVMLENIETSINIEDNIDSPDVGKPNIDQLATIDNKTMMESLDKNNNDFESAVSNEPARLMTNISDFVPQSAGVGDGPAGLLNSMGQTGEELNTGFGGASPSIQKRLAKAGAKTGDIQLSISWDTMDDIDLHVIYKNHIGQISQISWMNRMDNFGGMLDVDMNANSYHLNNHPVENIFWPTGSAPHGEFVVIIHFYRNWTPNTNVKVLVAIKVDGKQQMINTNAVFGQSPKEIYRFKR